MSYHTAERPWFIEEIRMEQRQYAERVHKAGKHGLVPDKEPGRNMFTIRTGNQWLEASRSQPMPKMLFGEFWHENELCILFADTNAGKSILAVQIGNSLTRTEPISPFAVHADPANVLYVDFELSGKQFSLRYSNGANTYDFGNGFFRAEFNPNADMPLDFRNYEEYVNSAIEYAVKSTGADILIIDNITCLRKGTERAEDALPLMKHLKALKSKFNLSVLVLAHTPKRGPAKPISINDLQGSKMLINFCDSAFAIGRSYIDNNLQYLKQIKQRGTGEVYGTNNVCLCRIKKTDDFLRFEFEGYATEHQLLQTPAMEKEVLLEKIKALTVKNLSQREISKLLNISKSTVNKYARCAIVGVGTNNPDDYPTSHKY